MQRLLTREVKIGNLVIGGYNPVRIQTMTTTDTMDTEATVNQSIRCIEFGAELVRITAPSKKEAENLLPIKNQLRALGYTTPLVADIHFTPNAAEIAARIVEKVRVNPGNYVDKKKFEQIEYTDAEYQEEIERIRERFTPLVLICKEHGTAMRIGTNHGSLSDRIMSRYGDTAIGMVESAMEFLRIARDNDYHQIVLSMKSSNPQVMIEAYRLLVKHMQDEFQECYPLHLGVTEAGDGEDGRIKSAIGIGTLLNDGIGDTIRVSLTEEPELELAVCRNILERYEVKDMRSETLDMGSKILDIRSEMLDIRSEKLDDRSEKLDDRSETLDMGSKILDMRSEMLDMRSERLDDRGEMLDIGGETSDMRTELKSPISNLTSKISHLKSPISHLSNAYPVVADTSKLKTLTPKDFELFGYTYNETDDKWHISDQAADYVFCNEVPRFNLPGTIGVLTYYQQWLPYCANPHCYPLFDILQYIEEGQYVHHDKLNFVMMDANPNAYPDQVKEEIFTKLKKDKTHVLCLSSTRQQAIDDIRQLSLTLNEAGIENPILIITDNSDINLDKALVHYAVEAGSLLLENLIQGVCLGYQFGNLNYSQEEMKSHIKNLNSISFGILQATRKRISKTEYISCPSCGRTLFDLQETTAKIRAVTNHLKGVKIAIMGCIVNGPGEMADADFGYVGSGVGKITLYKNKDIVKRNIDSEVAVDELINLLKENGVWRDN